MTEKVRNSEKSPTVVMSHNKNYATKKPTTPPGALVRRFCPECGGEYYCSEAQHRAAFHSRSPSE